MIQLAKSGDAYAFVELYDGYVERVYRYVFSRVINQAAAEGITLKVFRYGWEHFGDYQENNTNFIGWINNIARNQVLEFYKTNLKSSPFDVGFLLTAFPRVLTQEVQDLFNLETLRNQMKFFLAGRNQKEISKVADSPQADSQNLHSQSLRSIAKYLDSPRPKPENKPSATFNAYTRSSLTQFARLNTRHPKNSSLPWRVSLVVSVLIAAFLITGTASAQSSLPGDPLYSWKRTSENAWRTLSFDPVGTDIVLANRRLQEWIAVENDPTLSNLAMKDYLDILTQLKPKADLKNQGRLIPLLKAHRKMLNDAGLSTAQLDNYLVSAAIPITGNISNQVSIDALKPVIIIPTVVSSTVVEIPVEVAPIATQIATEVTSVATVVSIEVTAPATEVATEITPLPSDVPTEVTSPATDGPTEVTPPATDASTQDGTASSTTSQPNSQPTDEFP